MFTIDDFKPTGDVRKDYHAHSEIVVNRFIEHGVVKKLHRRFNADSAIHFEIGVAHGDKTDDGSSETHTLTLNARADHFGEYRDEIMNGIVHYVERKDLTPETESKLDSAVEDSESEDEMDSDDEQSDEDGEDYKERITRRLERAEQRRLEREKRFCDDDSADNSRKIIMPYQMAVMEKEGLSKIRTEVNIYNPEHRLEYVDIYCFSKAMETISFQLRELKLVGCRLSCQSVQLLSKAVSKNCIRTLRFFSIEMNPLGDVNVPESGEQSDGESDDGSGGISVSRYPDELVDTFQARQIQTAFASDDDDDSGGSAPKTATFESAIRTFMQSGVRHLSLRSCNIGDKGAAVVADVLKTDSRVLSLSLFGNHIGDDGAQLIANSLRTNRCLQSLDLGLNSCMTDATVGHVAESFREMELDTLEAFDQVRQSVYISHYGTDVVTSADAIPVHFLMEQDAKSSKTKTKSKKDQQAVEPLEEWDSQCRVVGDISAIVSARGAGKKKGAKDTSTPEENDSITYVVPGNTTLRHIGMSCNSNMANDSVRPFLQDGSILSGLERVNFSRTQVGSDILLELAAARMRHVSQKTNQDTQAPTQ